MHSSSQRQFYDKLIIWVKNILLIKYLKLLVSCDHFFSDIIMKLCEYITDILLLLFSKIPQGSTLIDEIEVKLYVHCKIRLWDNNWSVSFGVVSQFPPSCIKMVLFSLTFSAKILLWLNICLVRFFMLLNYYQTFHLSALWDLIKCLIFHYWLLA